MCCRNASIASRPWYSSASGGIVNRASSVRRATTPSMSSLSKASTKRPTSSQHDQGACGRLDRGVEWTVNAYTLTFAVLMMTAAALGDRAGRRRLFAAGLGLFAAASAACALAPDVGWLITARAVQGASAALVMPLALSLLSAALVPERRAWALGTGHVQQRDGPSRPRRARDRRRHRPGHRLAVDLLVSMSRSGC
jgi:MFS family permease